MVRWDTDEIDALLREEQRSRAFSAETRRDDDLVEAVTLVLETISTDAYAHTDRAWIPALSESAVQDAAEIQAGCWI
ncbi:hypothetical protein OJ998_01155 [Solirubrobacter taibaiensis]|nr:hypothetical protein [Solirubrobacter taibaiensis]